MNYKEVNSMSIGSDSRNVQETIKSISSNSGQGVQSTYGQQSYNPQQNYGQVDYLAKSNPAKQPSYNPPHPTPDYSSTSQLQSNNFGYTSVNSTYQAPSQSIPTKDYSQTNNYMSSTNYQTSKVADIPPKQTASSYESTLAKELIYTPKV